MLLPVERGVAIDPPPARLGLSKKGSFSTTPSRGRPTSREPPLRGEQHRAVVPCKKPHRDNPSFQVANDRKSRASFGIATELPAASSIQALRDDDRNKEQGRMYASPTDICEKAIRRGRIYAARFFTCPPHASRLGKTRAAGRYGMAHSPGRHGNQSE